MSIRLDHTGGIVGLKGASTGSITQFVIPKDANSGEALTVSSVASGVATLAFAQVGLPEGGADGQLIRRTGSGYEWFSLVGLLPDGGLSGQLIRRTGSGYEWFTQEAILPTGGAVGQALVKSSGNDYDVAWQTVSSGGGGSSGSQSPSETLDCGTSLLNFSNAIDFGFITEYLRSVWQTISGGGGSSSASLPSTSSLDCGTSLIIASDSVDFGFTADFLGTVWS